MKFGKKVSNIIKKEFESKPVYNEKYLRTKIKSIFARKCGLKLANLLNLTKRIV